MSEDIREDDDFESGASIDVEDDQDQDQEDGVEVSSDDEEETRTKVRKKSSGDDELENYSVSVQRPATSLPILGFLFTCSPQWQSSPDKRLQMWIKVLALSSSSSKPPIAVMQLFLWWGVSMTAAVMVSSCPSVWPTTSVP